MKDRRSAWQFRVLAISIPLIVLALGSFWLLEVMRRSASDFFPATQRSEPDFYVENFNYVKIAKSGKAEYHFSGDRLTHNPVDDSYDIVHPVVRNLGEQLTPTVIRSERAHVSNDNSQVHMYDNVHFDREASATSEPMHLESDYILLLPNEDVMKTHRPVVINVGDSILSGTGMHANNATRQYQLLSDVHGTYQVPPR